MTGCTIAGLVSARAIINPVSKNRYITTSQNQQTIIAIHQPNYLPWLGYFYKIYASDHFVFLDDVAYSRGSYTARTAIRKAPGSGQNSYLSVPVVKAPLDTFIMDLSLDVHGDWVSRHLGRLEILYRRAPFFATYFPPLEQWMQEGRSYTRLADWNIFLIGRLVKLLGLASRFSRSSSLAASGQSTAYLIDLVRELDGTVYHSGQGARKYQDPKSFEQAGIRLYYNDLYGFLQDHPYPQQAEPWLNGLSIVDALMHIGKDGILDLFRSYEQTAPV